MFNNGFTSAKVTFNKKVGLDKINVDISNFEKIRNLEDEEKSIIIYNKCFKRMVEENSNGETHTYVPISESDLKYTKMVERLFKKENIFAKKTYDICSNSDGECSEPPEVKNYMYLCWKGNSYKERTSLFCNKGAINSILSVVVLILIACFLVFLNTLNK